MIPKYGTKSIINSIALSGEYSHYPFFGDTMFDQIPNPIRISFNNILAIHKSKVKEFV